MLMLRKLLVTASAFSMVAAPVAAQATPRQASPVAAKDDLAGIGTFGILISVAVIAAVVLIVSHDKHDHPASP